LDEYPHLVLDGHAFKDAASLEGGVQAGRQVERQPLLLTGLTVRLLPSLNPFLGRGRQFVLGRPRPDTEIYLFFLACHAVSACTSLASAWISLLAELSGSISSTVRPRALSAKATRWQMELVSTGSGYCFRALATSRPMAVLAILRLMTNAALSRS